MATYDLTSKATSFINSDSWPVHPSDGERAKVYLLQTTIDIAKYIANGYTYASGDIFQALEVPANSFVLFAGAEVMTAFDGTTPVADIDFAAGDDIVDGGDLSAEGYLASGVNGQAMTLDAAASTYTRFITEADTIDVLITGTDVTSGVLRVMAAVMSTDPKGFNSPDEVVRDQLA